MDALVDGVTARGNIARSIDRNVEYRFEIPTRGRGIRQFEIIFVQRRTTRLEFMAVESNAIQLDAWSSRLVERHHGISNSLRVMATIFLSAL